MGTVEKNVIETLANTLEKAGVVVSESHDMSFHAEGKVFEILEGPEQSCLYVSPIAKTEPTFGSSFAINSDGTLGNHPAFDPADFWEVTGRFTEPNGCPLILPPNAFQ